MLPDVRASSWSIRSVRNWSNPSVGCASCKPNDCSLCQHPPKVCKADTSQRNILVFATQKKALYQKFQDSCLVQAVQQVISRMAFQQHMNAAYTFISASRKSLALEPKLSSSDSSWLERDSDIRGLVIADRGVPALSADSADWLKGSSSFELALGVNEPKGMLMNPHVPS